jgi:hypothetical protein
MGRDANNAQCPADQCGRSGAAWSGDHQPVAGIRRQRIYNCPCNPKDRAWWRQPGLIEALIPAPCIGLNVGPEERAVVLSCDQGGTRGDRGDGFVEHNGETLNVLVGSSPQVRLKLFSQPPIVSAAWRSGSIDSLMKPSSGRSSSRIRNMPPATDSAPINSATITVVLA